MNQKIKVSIVGASGYSGEQLVSLLLNHPHVELTAVTSRQYAGRKLSDIFPALPADHPLCFSEPDIEQLAQISDVAFLALPHGVAADFATPLIQKGLQVIDLSADFRLRSAKVYQEFYHHNHPAPALLEKAVYGLPEIHRESIKSARLIACPGCYPTSIILPTIPLLGKKMVNEEKIIADSLSGVSGAGRKAEVDFLFVECNESLRPYGVPKHRHLSEIEQELTAAFNKACPDNQKQLMISFTPHLIPVSRGILTTLYFEMHPDFIAAFSSKPTEASASISQIYHEVYGREPFIKLLDENKLPDTKNVVRTNFIEIGFKIDWRTKRIIVFSAIDNIIKGASGQAVQAFNIAHDLPETCGL